MWLCCMSDLKPNKTEIAGLKNRGPIDSVQRPDLVTLITESIRQRVLDGSYTTGHVLPAEAELAKAFAVSRNVMREALRQLRVLGLVEVSQGRPPRIRGNSPEASIDALTTLLSRCEIKHDELIDTRTPLELQVVSLLARAEPPPDLSLAAQANRDLNETRDFHLRNLADRAFHTTLAKATGNQLLATLVETVAGLSFEVRDNALSLTVLTDWPYQDPYPRQIYDEHNAILEAIARRDEEAARAATYQHMQGSIVGFRRLEEACKKGSGQTSQTAS